MKQIKQEELVMEVAVALKDVFVAQIESNEKEIIMNFTNGQKFVLSVQEQN